MCDFINTTFCRLCLSITEGQQTADLAGDEELCTILENVFPGMKLDLIPTPKICLTCKDKLKFSNTFKNTVLCNELKIESNKDCFINAVDTCRLCLKEKLGKDVVYFCENNPENNHSSNSDRLIRTITEIATAPLNFDNLKKPVMCTQCWSSVKDTYKFKKRCFDNEEILRNLSKNTNNGLNSLSPEEVFTAIILKQKALIRTSDKGNKTRNMDSESQCVVNLDSDNEDVISKDIETFLTYSTNKDPVVISDSDSDNDLSDAKNKDEPSDSECSEDMFDEEINDDVVEIRIKRPKNVHNTKLNSIGFKNRDIVMDVEQSKNHRYLGEVKEDLVKEEMSFEEHNIDYDGFSFEDGCESSIRNTSLGALSEDHVKVETTDPNTLSIPSNKMKKLDKSLTIHLVDCVKYQSVLNKTRVNTGNKKNSHPHSELRTINPPKRTIKCGECDFVTSSKDIMTRHMEKHILYSDTGNKCPNCQEVYRNPDILEEHIQSCDSSLRKKVPLRKLSKTTLRIFTSHNNKENSDSNEIGNSTTANKTRELVTHSTVKKYICDMCEKSFKSNQFLKQHRFTHCKERKFVCDVCQKRFKRKGNLDAHMVTHSTERNYICDICEKSFKSNQILKHHRLTHCEDRKFVCYVCQKKFKFKWTLIAHIVTHNTERNYICDVCEKSFTSNINLKHHQLTHCKEKKFGCDVCQKRFKMKQSLKRHQVIHRTKKNYTCDT